MLIKAFLSLQKTLKEIWEKTLEEIRGLLKSTGDPVSAVAQLQEENSELRREVERLVKEKSRFLKAELKSQIRSVDGVHLLTAQVDLDSAAMKDLAFELGSEIENLFLLLGAEHKGKAVLSCYISKELANQRNLNAGQIVRELGKYIQGGGGGQTRISADERSNSVLLSGGPGERLKMRSLIAHLDIPLENTGDTHVIFVK